MTASREIVDAEVISWSTARTTNRPGAVDGPAADGIVVRLVRHATVQWRDVSHVEARGNRVVLHTGTSRFLVRVTLAAMERRLQPHGFVRVHRSALVRIDAVARLEDLDGREALAELHDGTQVRVSRTQVEHVRRMLALSERG